MIREPSSGYSITCVRRALSRRRSRQSITPRWRHWGNVMKAISGRNVGFAQEQSPAIGLSPTVPGRRFGRGRFCLRKLVPDDVSSFVLRHAPSSNPGVAKLMVTVPTFVLSVFVSIRRDQV